MSSSEPSPLERLVGEPEPQQELLTDSEGEDDFVKKYGEIDFKYIKRPKDAVWFIRPHALNYFKDGVLYRTKGERSSAKTELFLDLLYVGIIGTVAGDACENASWFSLFKYVLVFLPYWTVWADIKDVTNYYYNEDLSQKLYLLWILVLLTTSVNAQSEVLESTRGAVFTIVPYILCRLSLAFMLLFYSFYIPEHRPQQRLYFVFLILTSCIWVPVIFVGPNTKLVLSLVAIVLEQITFTVVFHPTTKQLLKLSMSTALNIEHEVERMSAFFTVAIGEFLTKITAESPIGVGFTSLYPRAIFCLVIAYILFWLYDNAGTSEKAVHPLRHSAFRAITWIYLHIPLIGSVVLAADAAGELLGIQEPTIFGWGRKMNEVPIDPELNVYSLTLFFTGGLCVTLLSITGIGYLDDCRDPPGTFLVSKFWRIFWRVPVALLILLFGFLNIGTSAVMGNTVVLLLVLYVYESVVATPKRCLWLPRFASADEYE
ncbi:hypothetical protein FT663_03678 [Candidozyma haemuli var. vulneris]|uniref:Uncharacterized protein n=1 Tax=Candidozyma haemuli TaxID=45357 RepID=A0A2V1ATV4_9ASCO|nr:hypothetical protein CXQ85_004462 [[Candida] haemuloni]KAF3987777.1 hypothetical protein FT662_03795 [[Candida] haemuloni var. vulneris]KAF3989256.1 hypothetical protein FT663_03678 [[Candida] haemuloni var. vulneris]PVH20946.1 hypothetical protein CXQ85_004462 [[Candida] haemuloni]